MCFSYRNNYRFQNVINIEYGNGFEVNHHYITVGTKKLRVTEFWNMSFSVEYGSESFL